MTGKPDNWNAQYRVEIDGKTLDAIWFLLKWALQQESPPLSVIAACDCVHQFVHRNRVVENRVDESELSETD